MTLLLGARPGTAVVRRAGITAQRLSRNVWQLSRRGRGALLRLGGLQRWLPPSPLKIPLSSAIPASAAMPGTPLFHLAFPVIDLEATERWYVQGLGCRRGRRSAEALVLELGGHQLVAHLEHGAIHKQTGIYPRHFGLVFFSAEELDALEQRARAQGLQLGGEPRLRFAGTPWSTAVCF